MLVASPRPPRSPVTPAPPPSRCPPARWCATGFPALAIANSISACTSWPSPKSATIARQGLLPAETIRRQKSQRSHALLETPPVRHRVPTADRRRSQTKGGPGRTLGGGSIVSRGQLIPRTPALQTNHFPSPPPNPTTGKNRLLDTERRQYRAPVFI